MIAWTKEPKLLPTCPIGKFRGKPWPEVEAGFLGWMLRQPDMEEDLKWNARARNRAPSKEPNHERRLDMSRFIEAKSDQLNADDLIGTSKTITITRVTGNDGDQPVSIFYEGDNGKPFKPCKTIRRVLMGVWGKYANEYVGKSMTLYRDDKVTFGGLDRRHPHQPHERTSTRKPSSSS
jgi:hypothetical protein